MLLFSVFLGKGGWKRLYTGKTVGVLDVKRPYVRCARKKKSLAKTF